MNNALLYAPFLKRRGHPRVVLDGLIGVAGIVLGKARHETASRESFQR